MKRITLAALLLVCSGFFLSLNDVASLGAKEIIEKANNLRYGETSIGSLRMSVVRPKYTRTVEMKMWTRGEDYSMVLITAPAAEKGQVFMKREKEMWNYIPKISRMVKMPPSMMSQGWMGSDFTNDDLMNEGALVNEYDHSILAEEDLDGYKCYKIQSVPKADSDEIWGKVISWISKDDFYTLKTLSYDEDNYLVKTETASDIKTMHGRTLPTRFTIIPEDEPGQQTIVELLNIRFDEEIKLDFFSQQNMKRIR